MHIVITGDSWSNGAYDIPGFEEPSHPGIEYFLAEIGHRVTNLSVRGGSNTLALNVLEKFISEYGKPDLHIFWPCAFSRCARDYKTVENRRAPSKEGFEKLGLDFTQKSIHLQLKPYHRKICEHLKKLDCNTICFGGNTKFPHIYSKYFPSLLKSASELVPLPVSFEDSYFSDRRDLDMWSQFVLYQSDFEKEFKYDLVDKEMKLFITKHDAWHNPANSEWINMQHGTVKTHRFIFEKVAKDGLLNAY